MIVHRVTARRLLVALLAAGVVLAVVCGALLAAGRLLAAMGDDAASAVVERCALVAAVLVGFNLAALVYLLGYLTLRMCEEQEAEQTDV